MTDGPSPAPLPRTQPPRLRLVVDDREPRPGLADALGARWDDVVVGRLPVGDVEVGPRVLVERKTVADLVLSLEDGRLFRQAWGLAGACRRPLLVVEGEDPMDLGRVDPRSLRGALLSLTMGYRIPVLRTSCVAETAEWIAHLAWRERRYLARARETPRPTAPRTSMDLLAAIPGVGDLRARRLLDAVGSVRGVLAADDDTLLDVPDVGPATVRALRRALDEPPALAAT